MQNSLNGAVTLLPLSELQINRYLQGQPELVNFVSSDNDLLKWLNNPLLLSFFAIAYDGMTLLERGQLKNFTKMPGELRDNIFQYYVRERYQHESRKVKARGDTVTISFETLLTTLGDMAMSNIVAFEKYDLTTYAEVLQPFDPDHKYGIWDTSLDSRLALGLGETTLKVADFACRLQLMVFEGGVYRFIHLLIRNAFAFNRAIEILDSNNVGSFSLVKAIVTVCALREPRSKPHLLRHTTDHRAITFGYHEGTNVSSEAIEALKQIDAI